MEKEKISIILPVYNSQNTISMTIDSIIKQTYDNYELIIINDGSSDNSESICLEYANKYKKINYISIENQGVSNARNIGISKATGNYIMFIDSDDEYYENTLETVYRYIKEKYELIVFGYNRIHVNKNKTKEMNTEVVYLKDAKDKNVFIEKMQKNYLFNQIWNKVYKKEILINKFNQKLDNEMLLKFSQGSISRAINIIENKEIYEKVEEIISNIHKKDIIEIIKMSEIIYKSKEIINDILENINIQLMELSKNSYAYLECIDIVENTKKRLKMNANYDMCIDNMLLQMKEKLNI